jgi:Fe-S-cluster containining protein
MTPAGVFAAFRAGSVDHPLEKSCTFIYKRYIDKEGGVTMPERPFYAEGLHFSCVRCSACCRYEPGYVFLSKKDVKSLSLELQMGYIEFVETFCRWIPAGTPGYGSRNGSPGGGMLQLSLKEKANYDCIFWKEGCSVYRARPLQCRAWPFWPVNVASAGTWTAAAAACPGIGKGRLYSGEYIESRLAEQRGEQILMKPA